MELMFGVAIGVVFTLLGTLVIEASQPPTPAFPRPLPARFDTLARWGQLTARRVVRRPAPPPLPRRTPGVALTYNPPVSVWHVNPRTWRDRLTGQLLRLWLRCTRFIDTYDPLAGWDMGEWWRAAFYPPDAGRHRGVSDEPDWNRHSTQWLPVVERDDIVRPRGRARTAAEWARIMETNRRTAEVRFAHRTGGPRLVREVHAGAVHPPAVRRRLALLDH